MDKARIEKSVREILLAIGENPNREGLKDTPQRVARMYEEVFSCIGKNPMEAITVFKTEEHEEMVILRDIPFYSMCEHHLLPFYGKAHVAYIPKGRVIGLSKLPRLIDIFARRLQVQERLTTQIAETIQRAIEPQGVGVVIEARHLCMMMRGVEKQHSSAVTSSMLGAFREEKETRDEFLALIRGKGMNGS